MAEERIIVRLDIDGLEQNIQQIGELEREMRLLREEKKKIEKQTQGLVGATKEETKRHAELDEKIKLLRRDKSDLSREIKKLDSSQKANINTIDGLNKRNAQLTAQMRKVELTTKDGVEQYEALRAQFLANDKQVRAFNESLGRHQHNVGNYPKQVQAASMALDRLDTEMAQVVQAINRLNPEIAEERAEIQKLNQQLTSLEQQQRENTQVITQHQQATTDAVTAQTSFQKSVVGVVAGITAAIAAFNQISQAMQESIQLFGEQEKAERQLEFAAGGAAEALKEQARQIQANSTFGDEAIIQQQAYLASLGFTEQQIKDMIQASVDLSAATNMSLDSAVKNLAKTYSGLTGELGESVSSLRDLTQEELRAGAATEVIRQQFAGTAKEISETGIGALEKMENKFGDLQERLGEKLLPIQIKMREAQLRLFESLMQFSETKEGKGISSFFQGLFEGFKTVLSPLKELMQSFTDLGKELGKAAKLFGATNEEMSAGQLIGQAMTVTIRAFAKGFELLLKPLTFALKKFNEFAESSGLVKDLMASVGSAVENVRAIFSDFDNTLNSILGSIDNLTSKLNVNLNLMEKFGVATKGTGSGWKNLNRTIEENSEIQKRNAQRTKKTSREQEEAARKVNNAISTTNKTVETDTEKTKQNTEAKKEQTEAVLDTAEALRILNGNAFSSDSVDEDPIISAAQKRAEALENLKEKTEKAAHALEFFGMTNEQIFNNLLNDEELENYEKAVASVAAAWNVANQALNINFENRKQQIEQQAIAEKEAIEATTQSEEQKRIAIERAEQKKALAIEKIEQKQAKAQKAQAIIQSIINTAIAITKALPNPFLVGFAAATGAAQTALIASQQFAEGGQVADLGSGQGGVVPTTAQNIPALANGDNVLATVRTGEVILNDKQQQRLAAIASPNIFRAIGVPGFADGGVVPNFSNTQRATASRIETSSQRVADTVQRIKVVNVATDTTAMALQVQNNANEATLG